MECMHELYDFCVLLSPANKKQKKSNKKWDIVTGQNLVKIMAQA